MTIGPVDSHYIVLFQNSHYAHSTRLAICGPPLVIMKLFRCLTSETKYKRTPFVPTMLQFLRAVCVTICYGPNTIGNLTVRI